MTMKGFRSFDGVLAVAAVPVLGLLVWAVLGGGFFPSVDGPLHAFTARVFGEVARAEAPAPLEVRPVLGPPLNRASVGGLNGLAPFLGYAAAEAVMALGLVAGMGMVFIFLSSPGGLGRMGSGILGVFLGFHFFLFYGFYNFCFAIVLALPALAAMPRAGSQGGGLSWGRCAALGLLMVLSVLAHPLPVLVVGMVVGLGWLAEVLCRRGMGMPGYLGRGLVLFGGAFFLVGWFIGMNPPGEEGGRQAWADVLRFLVTAGFLFPLATPLDPVRAGVVLALLWTLVLSGWISFRRGRVRAHDWTGLGALVLAMLSLVVPDVTSGGSFFQGRLAFFAWLLAFVWLDGALAHGVGPVKLLRRIVLVSAMVGLGVSALQLIGWKREWVPVMDSLERAAASAQVPGWVVKIPAGKGRTEFPLPWGEHLHLRAATDHPGLLPLPYYQAWAPHFPLQYRAEVLGATARHWTSEIPEDWSPGEFQRQTGLPVVLVVAEGWSFLDLQAASPRLARELGEDFDSGLLDPNRPEKGRWFVRKSGRKMLQE
jgi:hypothetical protein